MQGPIPVTLPHIPGIDVAGTVDALGDGRRPASRSATQVIGFLPMAADGAAAEYVVAPAEILAPAPTSIPLADAAALPLVGLTAWQALFEHAELTAGQRVLINGAGGAVGGYAVQLAKSAGAHVIATASPRSSERVRTAGADEVIDHTTTEVTAAVTEPVDVVLNLAPIDPAQLAALVALVRPGGVVVNTTVWMPAPTDEERGVRGIDLFVRSDAEQLSRLVALVDSRRAARRRRPAGAAGRAAGGPRRGRRGHAARQGHRPSRRRLTRSPTTTSASPRPSGPTDRADGNVLLKRGDLCIDVLLRGTLRACVGTWPRCVAHQQQQLVRARSVVDAYRQRVDRVEIPAHVERPEDHVDRGARGPYLRVARDDHPTPA